MPEQNMPSAINFFNTPTSFVSRMLGYLPSQDLYLQARAVYSHASRMAMDVLFRRKHEAVAWEYQRKLVRHYLNRCSQGKDWCPNLHPSIATLKLGSNNIHNGTVELALYQTLLMQLEGTTVSSDDETLAQLLHHIAQAASNSYPREAMLASLYTLLPGLSVEQLTRVNKQLQTLASRGAINGSQHPLLEDMLQACQNPLPAQDLLFGPQASCPEALIPQASALLEENPPQVVNPKLFELSLIEMMKQYHYTSEKKRFELWQAIRLKGAQESEAALRLAFEKAIARFNTQGYRIPEQGLQILAALLPSLSYPQQQQAIQLAWPIIDQAVTANNFGLICSAIDLLHQAYLFLSADEKRKITAKLMSIALLSQQQDIPYILRSSTQQLSFHAMTTLTKLQLDENSFSLETLEQLLELLPQRSPVEQIALLKILIESPTPTLDDYRADCLERLLEFCFSPQQKLRSACLDAIGQLHPQLDEEQALITNSLLMGYLSDEVSELRLAALNQLAEWIHSAQHPLFNSLCKHLLNAIQDTNHAFRVVSLQFLLKHYPELANADKEALRQQVITHISSNNKQLRQVCLSAFAPHIATLDSDARSELLTTIAGLLKNKRLSFVCMVILADNSDSLTEDQRMAVTACLREKSDALTDADNDDRRHFLQAVTVFHARLSDDEIIKFFDKISSYMINGKPPAALRAQTNQVIITLCQRLSPLSLLCQFVEGMTALTAGDANKDTQQLLLTSAITRVIRGEKWQGQLTQELWRLSQSDDKAIKASLKQRLEMLIRVTLQCIDEQSYAKLHDRLQCVTPKLIERLKHQPRWLQDKASSWVKLPPSSWQKIDNIKHCFKREKLTEELINTLTLALTEKKGYQQDLAFQTFDFLLNTYLDKQFADLIQLNFYCLQHEKNADRRSIALDFTNYHRHHGHIDVNTIDNQLKGIEQEQMSAECLCFSILHSLSSLSQLVEFDNVICH